jgi:hypothetical protein
LSNDVSDQAIQGALKAAFLVISDGDMQAQLQDPGGYRSALAKLNLPESARSALLDIINRISQLANQAPPPDTSTGPEGGPEEEAKRKQYERLLLETFDHIRWSFWISLGMSVILFLLGMIFLGSAIVRSLGESAVSTATLTIAGLGIADFVLLFYSRPWKDISLNLSNTQQVRIIATSYLVGLSFVRDAQHPSTALERLTKGSVGMLEEYAEEDTSAVTKESKPSK